VIRDTIGKLNMAALGRVAVGQRHPVVDFGHQFVGIRRQPENPISECGQPRPASASKDGSRGILAK
jgi:hypothetical protein